MDNDFLVLSQDEQKRLEDTARQKALYDYNTLMEERFEDGFKLGQEIAKIIIEQLLIEKTKTELIEKMRSKGYTEEQIRDLLS